ncbi:uncharacterized protein F4822DRAFT_404570 [Hypoxylon trugodes]|uniref:uncharacterized protein n=1 Tax=Hypoxylon trugodes TaxID=326681 RepID=UPI0021A24E81|nr:uncharacterized protein F4822DRAFT_404570 [Hypoxylon trugodes]KAI1388974.1 hypothetical protein F4822DRAFT_404570 [Hypoxylon trugodes]
MQFSTITTLFTLAAVAIAVPTDVQARTESGECPNNQPNQVCCSNSILDCILPILGSPCGGTTYCCSTLPSSGPINVSILDCVKLL